MLQTCHYKKSGISASKSLISLDAAAVRGQKLSNSGVLDRLDEFEKHLDQLIGRLSQPPRPDWARSNLPSLTANPRLPLSDIVFTVSVTAYVTITTVLSVAFLLR